MPPLPADAKAAAASGADTALAFALEGFRCATAAGRPAPEELLPLFTRSLATLVRQALDPQRGDPAFRAAVLRAQDAAVQEHVRLAAHRAADARAVRTAVAAVAHPGKLASVQDPVLREALRRLHEGAASGDWPELHHQLQALSTQELAPDLALPLSRLAGQPALGSLLRQDELLRLEPVRRYRALCALQGPGAGTEAAAADGLASARAGADAEQHTAEVFAAIAALLNRHARGPGAHRVVRSLRTPAGFPAAMAKAKDEWDAAIVRGPEGRSPAEILLLAEVKAAPAAATPDFGRLLRGLQRLAAADADASYLFMCDEGEACLSGASLRRLQPQGPSLPPHVIYACTAAVEAQVQALSAATRGVLLAQPPSIAFAQALLDGSDPEPGLLAAIWQALPTAAHLRSALHQYQTAQAARGAMLHPDDLLAAVRAQFA